MRRSVVAVVVGALLAGSVAAAAPKAKAPIAAVMVTDRSGSMQGPKIESAKSAAIAARKQLPRGALFGMIAFDTAPAVVVDLAPARGPTIDKRIAEVQPGGGTDILPALEAARAMLAKAPARLRHVIVASDGQSPYDGLTDLAEAMHREGITVSTVAIGPDADQDLLGAIALAGGGRSYVVGDATTLPVVYRKEMALAMKGPAPAPTP